MTLVLVANILVQLLLSAFDIGSADEVLLVGLRNSSEGVVVSLVPSNGSLSLPISFLVPNYFVPPLCGTRSFRCGKPLALPAANVSLPIPAAQYLLLVPVTGAVLIADWRLAHSKMTLSGYAVKNVVGNECDPLSIMRATTTGTIYMVCLGETKLFLYTVNVNSTSVGSSTIPGHLLEYDFFQPPNLLSNFIYNGLTLLYFFEGNILYVLDLQYYQLIDYQMPLPACDAPYRSTAVGLGTSMKIVANCEASNTSAIIDINAENVNLVSGLVYPCTEDISTWFHIYQLSNAMRVETSRYNASSTANGVVFHSAVCVIGMDFTLLVTLVYVISEAAFQIAIFDGNVVSSTLSQAVGCAPSGCGLEVFSQCLLTTGGDALVFCVQNGSIGLDPVIDQNQFDSVFNVLFRIPTDAPTTTVLPSGSSSHGNPSPSGTTIPSKVQNGTTIIAVVVSVLVVMVVVVVVVVVAVMVAVKKKRRNFNCPSQSSQQESLALHSLHPQQGPPEPHLPSGTNGTLQPCIPEDGPGEGNRRVCNVVVINGETSSNGHVINTVPEEASQYHSSMFLVTGTDPSVPSGEIHRQNLIEQSPSEHRRNMHQSACVQNDQQFF